MSFSFALFASFQCDWDTTTSRLLGLATCVPHKDGGIPSSVLLKDKISNLAGLFATLPFL